MGIEIGLGPMLSVRVDVEVGFKVVCILLFVLHCSSSRLIWRWQYENWTQVHAQREGGC